MVDKVRRAEHRSLKGIGDERLKGTQYRWLENPWNVSVKAWRSFKGLGQSALKNSADLGDQGTCNVPVALRQSNVGEETLAGAAGVGSALATGADEEGRPNHQEASLGPLSTRSC